MVLNWAGIEWSAQFCCAPELVEAVRRTAEAITKAFPQTLTELKALGYKGIDILSTPITDAAGIARYVDSIWNSCVPIPQSGHTGSVNSQEPLAAGVHNYPEPMCAIPRVMHKDFVPFVVDAATGTAAVVAPVAPRGSGDGRVRVLFAERGHPLATQRNAAHSKGLALVLGLDPGHNEHWLQPRLLKNSGPAWWCRSILLWLAERHEVKLSWRWQPRLTRRNLLIQITQSLQEGDVYSATPSNCLSSRREARPLPSRIVEFILVPEMRPFGGDAAAPGLR